MNYTTKNMNWLKRQQPIVLYQSSDIPHVITDEGAKLCFDNCYSNLKEKDVLTFSSSQKLLDRISSNYYKFIKFPVTIPMSDLIYVPGSLMEGKVIKEASIVEASQKTIVVKSSYIERLPYKKFNKLASKLNHYKSFILVKDSIDPSVRALEDMAEIIYHKNWYRTAVTIASTLCKQRGVNWTKMIPEISMKCFGIQNGDLGKIEFAMRYIGIENFDGTWDG